MPLHPPYKKHPLWFITSRGGSTVGATSPKMENRSSSQIGPPEAVAVRTINIRRAHARYRNVNPFKRCESLKLLGYGNKQSSFASDCYTERAPSLRKTTIKRRGGREEKRGEAWGGQGSPPWSRKREVEWTQGGGKKNVRMIQHIQETAPRCSYLKINLPRDGTTSFWAGISLRRIVQLTHPPIPWRGARGHESSLHEFLPTFRSSIEH